MTKGTIHIDIITLKNTHRITQRPTLKRKKPQEMQGHIGRNTLIIRDCHSPLSVQDRSSGEKNKETEDLNNKVNRDLTDVCQTLHPDNRDYIFYSSTHSTFKHTYIHTHTHEEGKN